MDNCLLIVGYNQGAETIPRNLVYELRTAFHLRLLQPQLTLGVGAGCQRVNPLRRKPEPVVPLRPRSNPTTWPPTLARTFKPEGRANCGAIAGLSEFVRNFPATSRLNSKWERRQTLGQSLLATLIGSGRTKPPRSGGRGTLAKVCKRWPTIAQPRRHCGTKPRSYGRCAKRRRRTADRWMRAQVTDPSKKWPGAVAWLRPKSSPAEAGPVIALWEAYQTYSLCVSVT